MSAGSARALPSIVSVTSVSAGTHWSPSWYCLETFSTRISGPGMTLRVPIYNRTAGPIAGAKAYRHPNAHAKSDDGPALIDLDEAATHVRL